MICYNTTQNTFALHVSAVRASNNTIDSETSKLDRQSRVCSEYIDERLVLVL